MSGPGPIPFTSIDCFARRYGIDDLEEFEFFRRVVMAMDAAQMKYIAEKIKKESKTDGH